MNIAEGLESWARAARDHRRARVAQQRLPRRPAAPTRIASEHWLWVTNLPAPYRLPIWDRLSEFVELDVDFLGRRENARAWPPPEQRPWKYSYPRTLRVEIHGEDRFIWTLGLLRRATHFEVVVVSGWHSPVYLAIVFLRRCLRRECVVMYESTEKSHAYSTGIIAWVRASCLRNASLVITVGPSSRDAVYGMGVPESRVLTLFNPVDVERIGHEGRELRQARDGHRFIFVGRLIANKNCGQLIQAFSEIRHRDDTLTVVGSGPELARLKQMVSELRVQDYVSFVPAVPPDQVVTHLARADTLVLPSTTEVWGLVVNEALAAGLHAVVSDRSGVAASVGHMQGVYLTAPETRALATAMESSRAEWVGPIAEPEIGGHTPQRFAENLLIRMQGAHSPYTPE